MYLGLRARVVAVLATVSVLTLAVAAITLLSPLETRLRNNALSSAVSMMIGTLLRRSRSVRQTS